MTTEIHIFDRADYQSFATGDVIFKEGDPSGVMYALIEGEVEVTIQGKPLDVVGKGGIVGEMSLIDPLPRSATATAKTDCKLVPVDKSRFQFLIQQHPFFALDVMRILVERLRQANEKGVKYFLGTRLKSVTPSSRAGRG